MHSFIRTNRNVRLLSLDLRHILEGGMVNRSNLEEESKKGSTNDLRN